MQSLRITKTAKDKSVQERAAFLEKELKKIGDLVTDLQEQVVELQSWRSYFEDALNALTPMLEELGTRTERCEEATTNLHTIIDRMPFGNKAESTSIKTGLGILVDRGGAAPVNGDAARVGGGVVYTKKALK